MGVRLFSPETWTLAFVLVLVYAAFLLSWEILRLTPVGRLGLLSLADAFYPLVYVPLPFVILAFLLGGRTTHALVLAVPFIVFLATIAWAYIEPRPTLPATGVPLRVMTANVHYQNGDVAGLRRELLGEARRPDVVLLQELGEEMAARIGTELRDVYPYQALYPDSSTRGMGVISQRPFTRSFQPRMGPGQASDQVVAVEHEEREVILVNVHPLPFFAQPRISGRGDGTNPLTPSGQDEAFEELFRILDEIRDLPVVVAGDLNITDRQAMYRRLRERLGDAYQSANRAPGFSLYPSRTLTWVPPVVRVDYILHSPALVAVDADSGRLPGSDHRWVAADLAFPLP